MNLRGIPALLRYRAGPAVDICYLRGRDCPHTGFDVRKVFIPDWHNLRGGDGR